jgi:hypothetical protein
MYFVGRLLIFFKILNTNKMTNKTILKTLALACLISLVLFSCGNGDMKIPDPSKDVNSVKTILKGKTFVADKTGFFGVLTVNDKQEASWIDPKTETEQLALEVAEEINGKFSLSFVNDTAVNLISKALTTTGTYVVDDAVGEHDKGVTGIKLRLSYVDTTMSFGFGNSSPMTMTYTYLVKGINDKELLLQLPRDINRQPLIALLKAK